MEKIVIDNTNISVSRICLGTWAIGGWLWGGTDEQESIKTILYAFDQGINCIDTAPVYGFGRSEEIIGKALSQYGQRDKIILATKAGLQWSDGNVTRNASEKRISREIEDSLSRLQTDYIDIYQIHWPDPMCTIEETALAVKKLFEQGKIRSIGVSNFSTEQLSEFLNYCPVHVSQQPYNLFERGIEESLMPFTQSHNITTFAYGALCRGLLSGRMQSNTTFEGDDIRKVDPKFIGKRFQQYLAAVDALTKFSKNHYQKSILALSIRWILDKGNTVALWGARRAEQLYHVDDTFGWSLDSQAMKEIDTIINKHITDPVGPEFMAPPERVNQS